MILPRRKFLTGFASLLAAPAIVRAGSLMPIKVMEPAQFVGWVDEFRVSQDDPHYFGSGNFTLDAWFKKEADGRLVLAGYDLSEIVKSVPSDGGWHHVVCPISAL